MSILFNSFDAQIELNADSNVCIEYEQLQFWLKRFCPNIQTRQSGEADYRINLLIGNQNSIKLKENESNISGNWAKGDESFLAKYITQVFQKVLLPSDIFYVPAACVVCKEAAILIMGDFWQGKTSVALNSAKMIEGAAVLSDNYIAIKGDSVIGHTDYISLRNDNAHIETDENPIVIRNGRKFFCNKYENKDYKICGICIPHINEGDNNYHQVSREEAIWYLYQKLSRLLNGESVLFNGDLPSPIFNNMDTSSKILRIVKDWVDKYPLMYASGALQNISLVVKGMLCKG